MAWFAPCSRVIARPRNETYPEAFAFVLDDRPPRRNDILRGLSDTQFAAAHRADPGRHFGSRSRSRVRAWPLCAMAVDLHGTACSEPACHGHRPPLDRRRLLVGRHCDALQGSGVAELRTTSDGARAGHECAVSEDCPGGPWHFHAFACAGLVLQPDLAAGVAEGSSTGATADCQCHRTSCGRHAVLGHCERGTAARTASRGRLVIPGTRRPDET